MASPRIDTIGAVRSACAHQRAAAQKQTLRGTKHLTRSRFSILETAQPVELCRARQYQRSQRGKHAVAWPAAVDGQQPILLLEGT
eukprot:2130087-Pleurochrysis_carterae.AAC.1